MPSHIYLRTGDYADAVSANQRAIVAGKAYLAAHPSEETGYYGHNFHYLAAAAAVDGEYSVAAKAAGELKAHAHSGTAVVTPIFILLRFGRWNDVLSLPDPGGDFQGARYMWRFARGIAQALHGNPSDAYHEEEEMEREYTKLPVGPAFGSFFNDWSVLHHIAINSLDARMATARGDVPAAIRLWEATVRIQDGMNYDDLPDWYYPVRESLGALLLSAGQSSKAEEVFREDLRRNPRDPRSLFGLAKALESEGKEYCLVHAARVGPPARAGVWRTAARSSNSVSGRIVCAQRVKVIRELRSIQKFLKIDQSGAKPQQARTSATPTPDWSLNEMRREPSAVRLRRRIRSQRPVPRQCRSGPCRSGSGDRRRATQCAPLPVLAQSSPPTP